MKKQILIPPGKNLTSKIKDVLINYLKTQFILIIIFTFIIWVILTLLEVKYALVLSLLTGVVSTIPVLGITISAIIVALVAIFDKVEFLRGFNPIFEGLAILLIFWGINQLSDWLLSPYLIGKSTKVSPLILLLSTIIATLLFGLKGAILAIPATLIIKTIWDHLRENRKHKD